MKAWRVRGVALASMGLSALLWQCSLASDGLGDASPGGDPGGAAGDPGEVAAGQAGEGGSGSGGGGGGGVGEAGTAGAPGGAGGGGAAGVGGAGGAGCDPDKGEFEIAGAPGACFFFLAAGSKAQPESGRTSWTWPDARDDCDDLGGALASVPTIDEYESVRVYVETGSARAGLPVDDHVWIGASTDEDEADSENEVAASFRWVSGEPWAFVTPGAFPWNGTPRQPDYDAGGGHVAERCVQMRREDTFQFRMNNVACDASQRFALCERAAASGRAPGRARPARR